VGTCDCEDGHHAPDRSHEFGTEKTKGIITMDNQHRLIKGYRELTEDEVAGMNAVKKMEEVVLKALEQAEAVGADPRWIAIAKTDLQKGFMAAGRAIARPDGY
jgi:hypothetical protein